WWLLINGRLERFRFDQYRKQAHTVPGENLMVGTPLQPGQTILRGQAMALVTQAQERALATAIDTAANKILWQRQLGMVAAQDPVSVGDHLIIMDKKGGMLRVEAGHLRRPQGKEESPWRTGGEWLASGIDAASQAQLLVPPDKSFAVAVIYNPVND